MPGDVLLVFVDDDITPAGVDAVRALVDRLRTSRPWVLGPPEFVDEIDHESVLREGDEPVRTLGCVLEVSSTEEVSSLLDGVASVSQDNAITFGVEWDGEAVGWIEAGVLDRGLRTLLA